MIDDTFDSLSAGMGTFRTTIAIAPLQDQTRTRELSGVMVDTGSE